MFKHQLFILQWPSVPLNKCEGMINLDLRNPSSFSHKTEWDSQIVYKTGLFGLQWKQAVETRAVITLHHIYILGIYIAKHWRKDLQQNN